MAILPSDSEASAAAAPFDPTKPRKAGSIKCVVWDLDHTVWDGILLEDGEVRLRPGVREAIETLDGRGILHSIASRNDRSTALAKLRELGLLEYFLYPQIHWNPKSGSVAQIAKDLNLALDAFGFIDDQPHERDEVAFSLPQVLCLDASEVDRLVEMPELTPRFITEDSRRRRRMYQADIERNQAEEEGARYSSWSASGNSAPLSSLRSGLILRTGITAACGTSDRGTIAPGTRAGWA